jgi:hypothetical protein
MSEQQAHFTISTCHTRDPELADALADLIGAPSEFRQVQSLAGPNDIVQILTTPEGWASVMYIIDKLTGGAISEAGKDAWREFIRPRLGAVPAQLKRALAHIRAQEDQGQTVKIGLDEPTFCLDLRGDYVVLTDLSPEELLRHLYVFAHCAHSVSSWLAEVYKAQEQVGDVNATMNITDDGRLVVILRPCLNKPLPLGIYKRVYDAQGNIIEETTTP